MAVWTEAAREERRAYERARRAKVDPEVRRQREADYWAKRAERRRAAEAEFLATYGVTVEEAEAAGEVVNLAY